MAANEKLKKVVASWDWDKLAAFGATERNLRGSCEVCEEAITVAVVESVTTFSELQTVCYEAANMVNERPIGRHPTSPEDGTYLCPNDLLLGRSTSRVPSGPFRETRNPNHLFEFVRQIEDFLQQKWHTKKRNVRVGDVVLIQDSNQVRGNWKLGKVSKVYPGDDARVRKVDVEYKNPRPGEPIDKYEGKGSVSVQRAVHRFIVLVPVDDTEAISAEQQ